jgi:hypothetical protein
MALDDPVLMRSRRRKEARAVLRPSGLTRYVVRRFGAECLAAREFIGKRVHVVVRCGR